MTTDLKSTDDYFFLFSFLEENICDNKKENNQFKTFYVQSYHKFNQLLMIITILVYFL